MNETGTLTLVDAAGEVRSRMFSLVDTASAIAELARVEIERHSESEVIDDALDVLCRQGEVESCALYLADGVQPRLAAARCWDADSDPVDFAEAPVAEVLAGALPLHPPASVARASSGEPATGALLLLPVGTGGSALGVLALYHSRLDWFDEWRERSLWLYAAVLAHVLVNSRLVRTMENTVSERTGQLEAALREAEQLKRRYERLSNMDELTGLPNRRFFFPAVEAVLARAVRYAHPFSLLLMDIDHFKRINDLHGHATGDRVLREVATAVAGELREGDLAARFGGEEFVVALPNTDAEGALPLARRIIERVSAQRWSFGGHQLRVTLSLGLTELGGRSAADSRALLDIVLREADLAMYYCKRSGRNRLCTFRDLPADAPRARKD